MQWDKNTGALLLPVQGEAGRGSRRSRLRQEHGQREGAPGSSTGVHACVAERERTLIWSDNLRFASHLIAPHPSHARSCGAGLSG